MRVVSENSEADLERIRTRQVLKPVLREMAANFLRIVRGAGKPVELFGQLFACIQAMDAFQKAHGRWPDAELYEFLDTDKSLEEFRPWIQESRDHFGTDERKYENGEWERKRGFELIRQGSLQVIASLLVNQIPQTSMGEREIADGMALVEQGRVKGRAYYAKPKNINATLAKLRKKTKRRVKPKKDSG